jgi:hypothetical protein
MRKIARTLTSLLVLLFAGTAIAGDHNDMQNDNSVVLRNHIGSVAGQHGLSTIGGHLASNGNPGLAGE